MNARLIRITGAGKSTRITALATRLRDHGPSVVQAIDADASPGLATTLGSCSADGL